MDDRRLDSRRGIWYKRRNDVVLRHHIYRMHHSGEVGRSHPLSLFTVRLDFLSDENQGWIMERAVAEWLGWLRRRN